MSGLIRRPRSDLEFRLLEAQVQGQIDVMARLPEWPFQEARGFVTLYELDRVVGGEFGSTLAALAATYADHAVSVVGFDPPMTYYRDSYSCYPGFEIVGDDILRGYSEGVAYEPQGDPTGALTYTVNVLAAVGSSRKWALWSQRDWEIGLLFTPDPSGPWLAGTTPAFGRDTDLRSLRSPPGWGVPLSPEDLETFTVRGHEKVPTGGHVGSPVVAK